MIATEPNTLVVDALTAADWEAVRAIYAEGIASGDATFELEPPTWEEWDSAHLGEHRLVARLHGLSLGTVPRDGEVVAWAALSPVSSRCVYAGVAEVSVYVAGGARGRGVGRALLEALIASTEAAGIWTLEAGIFPENRASLALHEKCGFRVVGIRERLGKHHGVWRDVVLLERRSKEVG